MYLLGFSESCLFLYVTFMLETLPASRYFILFVADRSASGCTGPSEHEQSNGMPFTRIEQCSA